jgi:hypothetical protein
LPGIASTVSLNHPRSPAMLADRTAISIANSETGQCRQNDGGTRPRSGSDTAADRSAIDVPTTIAWWPLITCALPGQRAAQWRRDNCFRDQAVTNAKQLTGLLNSADVTVAAPGG